MNEDVEEMKIQFNIKLTELVRTKSDNNSYMSKIKYDEKLTMIKEIKNKSTGKIPTDYQRLKRYDIIKIGDDEKLVHPTPVCDALNIIFKQYVCNEEIFDILHETHLSIGHAGRNRMKLVVERNYKNITIEAIMIYLSLCKICQKKIKVPKNTKSISEQNTPVQSASTNNHEITRCQVDLIDKQDETDNGFKFILIYQDITTKYIQLRPLKSRQPEDIAHLLIDIFSIFGAPCILQSNHGQEFANKIAQQVNILWKDCRIMDDATQQHKDAQNLVQEITKMLNIWLKTNKTVNWNEGLRFVQLSKNRAYHEALKMSPHEAMFGAPIRIGFQNSDFSNGVIGAQCEDLQEIKNNYSANITKTENDKVIKPEIVTIKTEQEHCSENTEMWNVSECTKLCNYV